jgi:hypothetical protein
VRFAVPQAEQERSHPQHLAAAQHEAQVGFCLGLNWGQHLETFSTKPFPLVLCLHASQLPTIMWNSVTLQGLKIYSNAANLPQLGSSSIK